MPPDGMTNQILQLAITLFLIALGFVVGRIVERRHFRSLVAREAAAGPVLTNLESPPEGAKVVSTRLCIASTVITSDYFKRFGAALKALVGGRLRTLETLLERGRRESLQRLRAQAAQVGADMILNVRLETSVILRNRRGRSGAAAEVIAYGTAVQFQVPEDER